MTGPNDANGNRYFTYEITKPDDTGTPLDATLTSEGKECGHVQIDPEEGVTAEFADESGGDPSPLGPGAKMSVGSARALNIDGDAVAVVHDDEAVVFGGSSDGTEDAMKDVEDDHNGVERVEGFCPTSKTQDLTDDLHALEQITPPVQGRPHVISTEYTVTVGGDEKMAVSTGTGTDSRSPDGESIT